MRFLARLHLAVPAMGVAVLSAFLLVGCGSQETGARTTLAPIQPSSYVVREPATTTTTIAIVETGEVVEGETRSETEQQYTVAANDSVMAIAARFGVSGEELAAYNEWQQGIFQSIFPGDTVMIPPGALVPAAQTTTTTTDPRIGATGECVPSSYTVVAGDFPARLAERFEISIDQLAAANASNPDYASFLVGTVLTIPCP